MLKTFILVHGHAPAECAVAFAAWKSYDSSLRGQTVLATCGRYKTAPVAPDAAALHEIWWTTQAPDATTALAQLPPYVRDRTTTREVSEITIA